MQNLFESLSPWSYALLGLIIGSFLNVVIYRLPKMMDLDWIRGSCDCLSQKDELHKQTSWPLAKAAELASLTQALSAHLDQWGKRGLVFERSACPKCGHLIAWYENIPVLSWLFLKGRCSACKTKISIRYPAVELLTAVSFALIALKGMPVLPSLFVCGVMACFIVMTMIDWDTTLLPDDLTLGLMWAGFLYALLGWGISLQASVIGAIAGYMALWTLYMVFKLVTGREGMGHGDFKLLAAIGAWVGASSLPAVCVIASTSGVLAYIVLKLAGKMPENGQMPFGPYLCAGGAFVLLAPIAWLGALVLHV